MTGRAPHDTLLPSLVAASLAVLAVVPPAPAEQVLLEPSKDTTIFGESNSLSNGKGTGLFAGVAGSGGTRRALLAFDVAGAIPAGATVTSAQLTLQVTQSNSNSQTMTIHRLRADWGEGTSNSMLMGGGMGTAAAPGDATWRFRFFNDEEWDTDGGDFIATASAAQQALNSGAVTWGSTALMVADVQAWLDAPDDNFGWLLRGNETRAATAKRFASRETATAANRPKLAIVFDPPPGSATATPTTSVAPTMTATPSPTMAALTATSSQTRTVTATSAATGTATAVPPTPSATATHTAVPTPLPTDTATVTPSLTATPTASDPPSPTTSATPTESPPPTDTVTSAPTATATPEAPTPTPTETATAANCTGDCDMSGAVAIDELILGVNIALGGQPVDACPEFDPSGNGAVEISELVAAVNDALGGCQ